MNAAWFVRAATYGINLRTLITASEGHITPEESRNFSTERGKDMNTQRGSVLRETEQSEHTCSVCNGRGYRIVEETRESGERVQKLVACEVCGGTGKKA